MNLAEAYKAGRAKTRWTDFAYYEARQDGKQYACAFGAIAIGLTKSEMRYEIANKAGNIIWGRPLRYFRNVKVAYKCRCKDHKGEFGDPAEVIEHYSDAHRKTWGRDTNIIAMLEEYGLKRPVPASS